MSIAVDLPADGGIAAEVMSYASNFDQFPKPLEHTAVITNADGSGALGAMYSAIQQTVAAQSDPGSIPYGEQFAGMLSGVNGGSMALVDCGEVSTMDSLQDFIYENPVMALGWREGFHNEIKQYDPLFTIKSANANGRATIVSLPHINKFQAMLVAAERAGSMSGVTDELIAQQRVAHGTLSNNRRSAAAVIASGIGSGSLDKRARPTATRVGLVSTATSLHTDASAIAHLRQYAALTARGLYDRVSYLGPCVQVYSANAMKPNYAQAINPLFGTTQLSASSADVMFTYSLPMARGQIASLFQPVNDQGDNLFFTIANYSRSELAKIGVPQSDATLGKRVLWDISDGNDGAATSSFIGAARGSAAADSFVQIRAWGSRYGIETLGLTSQMETMTPDVADTYYVQQTERAAAQYRFFKFNEVTDEVELRPLLEQEGLQEAIANVPDLVLEGFLARGIKIRAGVVKNRLSSVTTALDQFNAHYDMNLLHKLPHLDILQCT